MLDETIFDANVDGVLEASVTPFVAPSWASEAVSFYKKVKQRNLNENKFFFLLQLFEHQEEDKMP